MAQLAPSHHFDGCIISDAHLERCVIGVRSIIQSGATIRNSVVMGADYYQTDAPAREIKFRLGSGKTASLIVHYRQERADCRRCRHYPGRQAGHLDAENYYLRDGIVVIPKDATIPPGFGFDR